MESRVRYLTRKHLINLYMKLGNSKEESRRLALEKFPLIRKPKQEQQTLDNSIRENLNLAYIEN